MSLTPLFEFTWQADPSADTVIPPQGRDGAHLSDGAGRARGELTGTMRFSMYTGDCPLDPGYLELAQGEPRASGDHICTVNPGALLETDDGALLQLDFRGFGLRLQSRAPMWSVNGALRAFTQHESYRWLTEQLLVFEGEFDESTGRGDYRVLAQDPPA
ncbi:MAG: hypothetical protein KY469_06535 [Actinobacteria bacterium]|nr:hypothetical protein [Actinomycetota bacterium]